MATPVLSSPTSCNVKDSLSANSLPNHDLASTENIHSSVNKSAIYDPFLHTITIFLSLSCLVLIFVGGLVKSHEAGLSVPDWPTTYGENMFLFPYDKWFGGIFYEHGHRLLASAIGALTLLVASFTLWRDKRSLPIILSIVAVVTVILQGVLGGLTVLYRLPAAISISHGILAQTFFLITITLSYLQSKSYRSSRQSLGIGVEDKFYLGKDIRRTSLAVFCIIYLQLIAGAIMRHNGAGMALLDLPTMGGSWWPSISGAVLETANSLRAEYDLPPTGTFQVLLHLIHRIGGIVVGLAVIILSCKVLRGFKKANHETKNSPPSPQLAHKVRIAKILIASLLLVTTLQITLGVISILTIRDPLITSLHVAAGAALLGCSFLIYLNAFSEDVNKLQRF